MGIGEALITEGLIGSSVSSRGSESFNNYADFFFSFHYLISSIVTKTIKIA